MKKIQTSSSAEILRRARGRRGSMLIIFMVSLAMLSLTAAALVRVTLLHRSMVRSNEVRIQSEWLFHSAVARAASQLKTNAGYDGEEWKIEAESLGQSSSAVAKISVETIDGKTNERRVAISVIYPPDNVQRATVSRTVTISL
jgi:flagellar basal body-associated protein FliL